MAMLRHKPTGDLYVMTELLAKRDDMEVVEPESAPVALAAEPEKKKRSPKAAAIEITDIPEIEE